MRRQSVVIKRASTYLATYSYFTFSVITRYEVLRGLKAKGATRQLAAFEQFCNTNQILPITNEIIVQAAEIYADLYRHGLLISDADILIAATARVHKLVIATNNETHFKRVPNLVIENWLK